MFYERKIKYLSYLIKDEKVGSAGFVKFEIKDSVCNITINVGGLRMSDSRIVKVFIVGEGMQKELCSLELIQGKGRKQLFQLEMQNIGNTCIAYQKLEAIRIPLSSEHEIYGVLSEKKDIIGQAEQGISFAKESEAGREELRERIQRGSIERQEESEEEFVSEKMQEGGAEGQEERRKKLTSEKMQEGGTEEQEERRKKLTSKKMQEGGTEGQEERREKLESEKMQEGGTEEKEGKEEPREEVLEETQEVSSSLGADATCQMPLCENKWMQLWKIYPHINPFRDEREYLSIGPCDFVLLPEKYFCMVNNSFLLHGYYNYKHLILKRMKRQGEVRYYIGVPGNFYEREKQVAVMFGFESFESLEESAATGDYGYYLMRIAL